MTTTPTKTYRRETVEGTWVTKSGQAQHCLEHSWGVIRIARCGVRVEDRPEEERRNRCKSCFPAVRIAPSRDSALKVATESLLRKKPRSARATVKQVLSDYLRARGDGQPTPGVLAAGRLLWELERV